MTKFFNPCQGNSQPTSSRLRPGFTLAESMIALGILVVLITGFLAVFGPAADTIRRTLSAAEASRLQDTLTTEMTSLKSTREINRFQDNPMNKAFEWVTGSTLAGSAVVVYKYRANPSIARDDGTQDIFPSVEGIAGQDYIIQPIARRVDDPEFFRDLQALEGRIYLVKMVQMVFESGSWQPEFDIENQVPGQRAQISDPFNGGRDFGGSADQFTQPALLVEASFYPLPSVAEQYLRNVDPTTIKRPAFTRSLVLMR